MICNPLMDYQLLPEDEIEPQWYDFLFDADPILIYGLWIILAFVLSLGFCWILLRSGYWWVRLRGILPGGGPGDAHLRREKASQEKFAETVHPEQSAPRVVVPEETLSRLKREWEQARLTVSSLENPPPLQGLALALVELGTVTGMERNLFEGWAEVLMKESSNRQRVDEILQQIEHWMESA